MMLRYSRFINSDFFIIKRFLSLSNESEITSNNYEIEDLSVNETEVEYESSKKWELYRSLAKNLDPSLTSIILFPGQGSQYIGMGKKLFDHPSTKSLFEVASQYLKTDIKKLCLQGPAEKLNKTIHCQPAIYCVSLASLQLLREENPELIENCVATAGNSLGEISALVFAGSISFEQGLHLVRIRAEHMQKSCDEVQGGLLTVFLNHKSELNKAMYAAKLYCKDKLGIENPVCQISTYLFTEAKIVGGNIEALEFLETFSKDFHLSSTKRLNVSGAFHTELMCGALGPCRNALKRIGPINRPKIPVMSNVTGTIHTSENSIRRLLGQHVCKPVMWEQSLMRLYMRPPEVDQCKTVEIGPGKQLVTTVKRVNQRAITNYVHYDQ